VKGYISKFNDWLDSLSAPKDYDVDVLNEDFVSNASVIREDSEYVLVIEFSERVFDGNEAKLLSIIRDGELVNRYELYAGETKAKLNLNAGKLRDEKYEIVIGSDDGSVISNSKIHIRLMG